MITHSKRTMEAAQALYGVTCRSRGYRRLVSVRFNAAAEAGRGGKGEGTAWAGDQSAYS
jgi:hypothetical protein